MHLFSTRYWAIFRPIPTDLLSPNRFLLVFVHPIYLVSSETALIKTLSKVSLYCTIVGKREGGEKKEENRLCACAGVGPNKRLLILMKIEISLLNILKHMAIPKNIRRKNKDRLFDNLKRWIYIYIKKKQWMCNVHNVRYIWKVIVQSCKTKHNPAAVLETVFQTTATLNHFQPDRSDLAGPVRSSRPVKHGIDKDILWHLLSGKTPKIQSSFVSYYIV